MLRQAFEYHPVIGFRFIPGIKTRIPHEGGGYLVRANETGFRCDHSFKNEKPVGIRRALLFGNSFTAGDGVSNGHRYGDYLEKLIDKFEVYNFGLPATGTDQHFLIYREFAMDIDHDLLIIAVFVENIRRVASRYRYFFNENGERVLYEKPYFTIDHGKLVLNSIPPRKQPVDEKTLSELERQKITPIARFPNIKEIFEKLMANSYFRKIFITSGLKDRFLRLIGYQPMKEYEDKTNPHWLTMRAIIEEWIAHHNKPVILIPIPLYHYVARLSNASHYQARFREVTSAAGGVFHNPLPDLVKYSIEERQTFYFKNDGHLTKQGHYALAKSLVPPIEKALKTI